MHTSVMVVEEDAPARDTIVDMLDTLKYATVGIENAKLARALLEAVVIDVVIVSLAIGDPDGTEVAAMAKARQRDIEVIVVSGRNPPKNLDYVADAFAQKPFASKEIDKAIKDVQLTNKTTPA